MGDSVNRIIRMLLAVTVGLLSVSIGAMPAMAHNSLTGSSPADGARLAQAPATVRLTFLATLDPATTKVTVTGPDGSSAGGAPTIAAKVVTVPFTAGPAGRYTVAYQVASDDGHPVKGQVRFTVTSGAAPVSPSPAGSVAAPVSPAGGAGEPSPPAVAGAPVASAVPMPLVTSDGPAWWLWALGGLLLAALVGGGAVLLGRRRTGPRG